MRRHAKGVFSSRYFTGTHHGVLSDCCVSAVTDFACQGRNTVTDMNRPQEFALLVDLNLRARVYLRLSFLMVRLHG